MGDHLHDLYIFQLVFTIFGLIANSFNIITFLYFKSLRNFAFELVFYLSVSCFLSGIAYSINLARNTNDLCIFQGFLILTFESSENMWIILILYTMYRTVVVFDDIIDEVTIKRRLVYLFFGFILPLIFTVFSVILLPISNDKYMTTCWLSYKDSNQSVFDYVVYIVNCIDNVISILISVFLIVKTVNFLKKCFNREDELKIVYKLISKLKWYPIIQFIGILPITIKRILDFCKTEYNEEVFSYFIVPAFSIRSFLYAIAFGQNYGIKDRILEYFTCCKKKKQEQDKSLSEILNNSDISMQTN